VGLSTSDLVIGALLFVGVGTEILCCIGVVVARDVFDRLHFVGPASTLGPVAIGAAVVVEAPLEQAGVKSIIVVLVLVLINPVLTHATARAARVRQFDHFEALPQELVDNKHEGEKR
jgi:multicomponent Na+:H+ antiporter subunit G